MNGQNLIAVVSTAFKYAPEYAHLLTAIFRVVCDVIEPYLPNKAGLIKQRPELIEFVAVGSHKLRMQADGGAHKATFASKGLGVEEDRRRIRDGDSVDSRLIRFRNNSLGSWI
jgi:hypothetical protein